MKEIDNNEDGQINYSEFFAATIDVNKFMTEEKLQAIFHLFDTDGCGKINPKDMH